MTEIKRIAVPPTPRPPPLWEGRPSARSVAVYLLRIRWIGAYFAALMVVSAISLGLAGMPPAIALPRLAGLLVSASLVCALVLLAARRTARTTRYTLTETHLVMNYGLALSATLAIPLAMIEHVALRLQPDHSGDIAVKLSGGHRIGYLKLFPHARPFRLGSPEPMLRAVPQAAVVGGILARAVAAQAGRPKGE